MTSSILQAWLSNSTVVIGPIGHLPVDIKDLSLPCTFFSSIIIRLVIYLPHKFALELILSLIASPSDEIPFFVV